ncbi:Magnesium transporter NIPA2 [Halotydeus destructor]|nr:Magnesium transporter NIPA2 [Halotydeus destructor]
MVRTLLSALRGKVSLEDNDVVAVDLSALEAIRTRFWVGVALAVTSCLFIGASFVIKKLALLRLGQNGQTRAGSGGYGYLRDWLWWAGFLSLGFGEAFNFIAYALAPASLVTPLGALSVLISAILASHYLKESLNLLGKLGCALCVIGSTMIVIHAPEEAEVDSLEDIGAMLTETGFLLYVIFVALITLVLIFVYAPLYGDTNLVIYILICSMIGSFSVMACKGLGLAIRETLSGTANQLANGLFWIFLVAVIGCITVQMNYLNKALDIFSTSLVTPVYYVLFTTFVLIASTILFKEWNTMSAEDVIGSLCGFLTTIVAIFLLNGFRDMNITLDTLIQSWHSGSKTSQQSSDLVRTNKRQSYRQIPGRKKRRQRQRGTENAESLEESGSSSDQVVFAR